MELVLFTSTMPGIGTSRKDYFYSNPLPVNAAGCEETETEFFTRTGYVECFCCPSNLVRTIAKVSGWAYSLADNGVAVNLYGGNTPDTTLIDGSALKLNQESAHP